jgi:hypothetical protein
MSKKSSKKSKGNSKSIFKQIFVLERSPVDPKIIISIAKETDKILKEEKRERRKQDEYLNWFYKVDACRRILEKKQGNFLYREFLGMYYTYLCKNPRLP